MSATRGADPRELRNAALQLTLVTIAVGLATGAMLVVANGTSLMRLAVAAAVVALGTLILSGNARLACLYGLLLSAPLSLGKNFLVVPHMGGALSFRIDLVDFFVLGLAGFQFHDLLVRHWRTRDLRLPRLCLPWIGLTLLGLVFVVLGPYRSLTLMEMFRMTKCLLLFLVLVNELRRVRQFGHVVLALLLGLFMQSAIGLAQYALKRQLGLQAIGEGSEKSVQTTSQGTLVTGEFVNRVGGLLGNSNVFAAFLALLLPLAVALLFTQVDLRLRAFSFVTVLAGTAALLATLSRTGWIGFGVALVGVLVLGSFHRRTRWRHALRRAVMLAAIGVVLLAFSRQIFLRLFYSDSMALRSRLEWVDVAWSMVKDKPIIGHGLNTYVFLQAPYTRYGNLTALQDKYGELLPVVHNNYLIVWVEQGTIGLLLFLALQVQIVRAGLRNLKLQHETLFAINVGCLCGIGALFLDWMASFSLRVDAPTRMYWIQVAVISAIDYWNRAQAPGTGVALAAPALDARRDAPTLAA